ncbi:MAG: DUF2914 domain-containing protein [Candidatus Campbellbacteria bacterium]|nr:DUF2914 domain-containing protein [Candidatus Campbellbacteria bacterium]
MLKRIKEWSQFRQVRDWYKKYERYLLPGALLFGFIGDTIAVRTLNIEVVQIILLVHLVLIGIGIIVVNLPKDAMQGKMLRYIRLFIPLVILYSYGALFSIFIVLYSHSGAITTSWPFLLPLIFLFVGTELFKKQYMWLTVQVSAYFFAIMSYLVLFVPYMLRDISTLVFLLSGVLSVIAILVYLWIASRLAPRIGNRKDLLLGSVTVVFLAVNFLYFANLIPPFPLSLRDAGVYHNVERNNSGEYKALAEVDRWYEWFLLYDTIHIAEENSRLYLFSSIFAPTNLNAEVVHNWKRWSDGGWVSVSSVSFPVYGGRDQGYRGYTYKSNVSAGWWRVTVETESGRVIGSKLFRVVDTDKELPRKTETR